MRIGGFFFDSQVAFITDSLSLPLKISHQDSVENMLESCGTCVLGNIKTGVWVADLQLVRCPVCELETCEGTMQTLDARHVELLLCEGYQDGSWQYELIGSHALKSKVAAATGAIFDVKHLKDRPMVPSSLPDPPHLKKRRKLTWHERYLILANMKLWTVLATWAPLVILAIGLVCAARAAGAVTPPPSTAEDAKPTFRYNTVKFTVSGATEETYDEFRGKMLDKLTGGMSYQEIPVTRNPSTVPLSQRFILVQLSNYAEQNITLAVDVTNVHVVGYLSSPSHFWYFNDAPQPQISQLFPGSARNPLGFGGSYVDLHRLARQNREQIPLSMASLDQAITTLHLTSKATTDMMKSVARSLIVCTQMVSEVIRFAYIEDMVLENIGSQYIPDPQVISYEQNWVALSRAIQEGDGKHLKPPVKLLDTKGKPYTVTLVYDVAGPLSLMLFAKPKAD